ncbi:MAG: Hsp70 family protein, partial [Bellilinea sp.]
GVNPDEVVAIGAAIQGAVLGGDVKDVILVDVTPLTLSVETLGGVATPLVERNSAIPTSKSQIFSTAADGQTQVEIHVVQGERPMASDNKSLGRFNLDKIPPAPRGIPQIEVTFDIDANGIMTVTAKDKATGNSQHITITASSGLSDSEVEKMRQEAEVHADDDRRRKELVEVRNYADNTVYAAEKTLAEHGAKVADDVKQQTEQGISRLKEVMQGEDVTAIRQAADELGQTIQKIGASMYQQPEGQSGPAGESGEQPGSGPSGEDVVEGDFKEG